MTKKLMLAALVLALAAAAGFASGEEETSAATMAADGEPVYCGTFTIAPRAGNKLAAPTRRTRTAAARGTPR